MSSNFMSSNTSDRAPLLYGRASHMPLRSNGMAIVEGLVLFGGLVLLAHYNLLNLQAGPVHPFLFVVVLMSAQYGAAGGILSAMAATFFTYVMGWPVRPVEQDYYDFLLSAWADPLSWICAGLLVGVVTSRQHRALKLKVAELEAAETAQMLISEQYEVMAERTRNLERQLAGLGEVPDSSRAHDPSESKNDKKGTQASSGAVEAKPAQSRSDAKAMPARSKAGAALKKRGKKAAQTPPAAADPAIAQDKNEKRAQPSSSTPESSPVSGRRGAQSAQAPKKKSSQSNRRKTTRLKRLAPPAKVGTH